MGVPKLVLVEWEDAKALDSEHTWSHATEHTYTPLIMHSVGFVLYEGPEGLILTSTYSDTCVAPRDQISTGMIRKVTVLRRARGDAEA